MDLNKYIFPDSAEVKNIQTSLGSEDDKVKLAIQDILNQIFINTATRGLDNWEKYLGLKIDKNETYENRRARIMTRLRGQGTVTKSMLKNVCESFVNGTVEIIENSPDYSFVIKFTDIRGVPSNIEYLKSAIEDIKPAHLNFSFQYLYTVWQEVKTVTWGQVKTGTWEDLKTRKVI